MVLRFVSMDVSFFSLCLFVYLGTSHVGSPVCFFVLLLYVLSNMLCEKRMCVVWDTEREWRCDFVREVVGSTAGVSASLSASPHNVLCNHVTV